MKRKGAIKTILFILLTIAILVFTIIVYYQIFIFLLKVLFAISIFSVFILGSSKK